MSFKHGRGVNECSSGWMHDKGILSRKQLDRGRYVGNIWQLFNRSLAMVAFHIVTTCNYNRWNQKDL